MQLVNKQDLENYYIYLNDSKLRKNSKQLYYTVVVAFYQYYMHLQSFDNTLHFKSNPLSNIKRKWKPDKEVKKQYVLTNDEIRDVLFYTRKDYRIYILFYLLADTSMRLNGCLNIKIKNIDLEDRSIVTFDKGKMRKYLIGEKLKDALKRYIPLRKRINSIHKYSEYLFCSRKSKQMSTGHVHTNLFIPIRKYIKRKFNKDITPHRLRVSFKTNRTNMSQIREQIEALMNHKNGLDNVYNQPTSKMLKKQFDKYERL